MKNYLTFLYALLGFRKVQEARKQNTYRAPI
jgi:hypothetical protein